MLATMATSTQELRHCHLHSLICAWRLGGLVTVSSPLSPFALQLKAVCVEAGMLALRRDGTEVTHEDFVEGITQVQAKKKANLAYYA